MAKLIHVPRKNDALAPAAGGLIALLLGLGLYRARRRMSAPRVERYLLERSHPPADAVAPEPDETSQATGPDNDNATQVGDWVQWESNGVVQFWSRRVDWVSDDGLFARVQGSLTGLPVGQLSKAAPPDASSEPEEELGPVEVFSPGHLDEVLYVDPGAENVQTTHDQNSDVEPAVVEPIRIHPELEAADRMPAGVDGTAEEAKETGFFSRHATLFAGGLMLGAAATAWIVLDPPSSPAPSELPRAQTSAQAPKPTPVTAAQQQGACFGPPMAAAGDKDGRIQLTADLSAKTNRDLTGLVVAGKQAAAEGRPHDAEVAFLMACRIADKLNGPGSEEAADARSQLARHYANLALAANSGGTGRTELLKRAEGLYADSLQTYLGRYGDAHDKSRFAGEGLKAVWQTLANPDPPPATAAAPPAPPQRTDEEEIARAPSPEPEVIETAPAAQARAQSETSVRNGAPAPARSTGQASTGSSRAAVRAPQPGRAGVAATGQRTPKAAAAQAVARPSFDCRRARSSSEKAICSDTTLAQLDRELGHLYVRAKNSASNPAAFRRISDQEWRRREQGCRGNRECLLKWYSQRRTQLLNQTARAR